MLRQDIIEAAGKKPNIFFPIFTNGTFMDEEYFALFDKCRNLLPIMSIEGEREITDARRGSGIYDKLIANMDELHKRGRHRDHGKPEGGFLPRLPAKPVRQGLQGRDLCGVRAGHGGKQGTGPR